MLMEYNRFICPLKALSKDDSNNICLIDDETEEHRMYNFDAITKKINLKYRGERAFSCDAYYKDKIGKRYLIEFKNQQEGNIDRKEIRNKIYDSISTILINENEQLSNLSRKLTVILVYNNSAKYSKNSFSYKTSEAVERFKEKLAGYGNIADMQKRREVFNLEEYRGVFCVDAYAVDKNSFEENVLPEIFS